MIVLLLNVLTASGSTSLEGALDCVILPVRGADFNRQSGLQDGGKTPIQELLIQVPPRLGRERQVLAEVAPAHWVPESTIFSLIPDSIILDSGSSPR